VSKRCVTGTGPEPGAVESDMLSEGEVEGKKFQA